MRMPGPDQHDRGDTAPTEPIRLLGGPSAPQQPSTTTDVPVMIGDFVLVGSRAGDHLLDIDTGKNVAVAEEGRCRENAWAVFGDVLVARANCRERPPGSDVVLSGLRAYNADLDEQWSWQAPPPRPAPVGRRRHRHGVAVTAHCRRVP